MVPVEYVDVRQQLNGLWPCPWPRCTADVFTPEELHEHLDLSHPTGPYYLLRGNDGEIVEMNDISNALVLHKDWGIGEGELYWLVSTFGIQVTLLHNCQTSLCGAQVDENCSVCT